MMKKFAPAVVIFLAAMVVVPNESPIIGCGSHDMCSSRRWGYAGYEFDAYNVGTTLKTPSGILFDPSGMPISAELIDRLTDETETCLRTNFGGKLSDEDVRTSSCLSSDFHLPIDRSQFIVKIASDWLPNCDKTEQVLPVLAGSAGCIAKGLSPTETCPCRWRAGIKCPNVLIVTPNFYLYKDVLIRFTTGCQNPWATPMMAKCASPSTTPMSDGTDPRNGL